MSWSYLHSFIGARLEGSLLFMETVSTLAEKQNLYFFSESYIFNIFIFEETVNCFSEVFEVHCMCKNIEPTKYQLDAKTNYSYSYIYYKKCKSGLSKTN